MRNLRKVVAVLTMFAGVVLAPSALAQAPQAAPAGVSAAGCCSGEFYWSTTTPKVYSRGTFNLSTGSASLVFQSDGNLVLRGSDGSARWSSGTAGRGNRVAFQGGGYIVVYPASGAAIWHSPFTTTNKPITYRLSVSRAFGPGQACAFEEHVLSDQSFAGVKKQDWFVGDGCLLTIP